MYVFVFIYYLFIICYIAFTILTNVFLYKKMGKPGWAAIIPFYSTYVEFDAVYGDGCKMFMLLIPFYGIYVAIKERVDLARAFGQGTGFCVGMILLSAIFNAILAFGSATFYGAQPSVPARPYVETNNEKQRYENLTRLRDTGVLTNEEYREMIKGLNVPNKPNTDPAVAPVEKPISPHKGDDFIQSKAVIDHSGKSALVRLKEYDQLRGEGILDEFEFSAKKKAILPELVKLVKNDDGKIETEMRSLLANGVLTNDEYSEIMIERLRANNNAIATLAGLKKMRDENVINAEIYETYSIAQKRALADMVANTDNATRLIRELMKLRDDGILTNEEFAPFKAELVKKL